MPDRYHIHVVPLPGRFRRVGKFGSVDWREDCSRCTNCVKPRCLYDAYRHESAHNRDPAAPVQTLNDCKACLSCVQGCTKGLLAISVNPEFLELGDAYWKPDILLTTWNQSDNGKVPVSGAGYRGRFHGPGFDSIWTDMSEIVRPTRDGIHGREYISTSVDVGSKPMRLSFGPDGAMRTAPANLLELQLPAILDMPAWEVRGTHLSLARVAAAQELHSLAVIPAAELAALPAERLPFAVPLLGPAAGGKPEELPAAVRMVELHDGPGVAERAAALRKARPALVVSVRMPLRTGSADRAVELARAGLPVLHLCADRHGREHVETLRQAQGERGGAPGRHLKDTLREVHGRLVKEGVRDEVTLVAGGGIALPEHMAKAIICGADLVAVDTPLLVALGCRVCRDARTACSDSRCPAEIAAADEAYATQRMVNLMGAWHSQLIEVLGAMGIREVRRLRGEVGRAMFLEDIEKDAFGDIARVSRAELPT